MHAHKDILIPWAPVGAKKVVVTDNIQVESIMDGINKSCISAKGLDIESSIFCHNFMDFHWSLQH